jgi:predicted membrane GTPase involved in stress response
LFVSPQDEIYAGMIVGENARPEDLPVNPCKAKHLTNMRSQGEGKNIQLEAPLRMSLARTIEYIDCASCRARIPIFTWFPGIIRPPLAGLRPAKKFSRMSLK